MLTSSIKFIRIYSWFVIKTAMLMGNLRPIYRTVLYMSLWAATRTSLWMALLSYISEVWSQALVSKHHLLSEVSHTVKAGLYYTSVSVVNVLFILFSWHQILTFVFVSCISCILITNVPSEVVFTTVHGSLKAILIIQGVMLRPSNCEGSPLTRSHHSTWLSSLYV